MESEHFPLNTLFKPSPKLVSWFGIDYLILTAFIVGITFLPILVFEEVPAIVTVVVIILIAVLSVFFFAWLRLYYESMFYELREDEMSWKRGVWFRATGIVPYNRITNIDIRQGPVMRALGISTLSVQTAGYSGQAVPEIRIEAIVHAEELRELIRSMVRASPAGGGDGTGTGPVTPRAAPQGVDMQILAELRAIREILERKG